MSQKYQLYIAQNQSKSVVWEPIPKVFDKVRQFIYTDEACDLELVATNISKESIQIKNIVIRFSYGDKNSDLCSGVPQLTPSSVYISESNFFKKHNVTQDQSKKEYCITLSSDNYRILPSKTLSITLKNVPINAQKGTAEININVEKKDQSSILNVLDLFKYYPKSSAKSARIIPDTFVPGSTTLLLWDNLKGFQYSVDGDLVYDTETISGGKKEFSTSNLSAGRNYSITVKSQKGTDTDHMDIALYTFRPKIKTISFFKEYIFDETTLCNFEIINLKPKASKLQIQIRDTNGNTQKIDKFTVDGNTYYGKNISLNLVNGSSFYFSLTDINDRIINPDQEAQKVEIKNPLGVDDFTIDNWGLLDTNTPVKLILQNINLTTSNARIFLSKNDMEEDITSECYQKENQKVAYNSKINIGDNVKAIDYCVVVKNYAKQEIYKSQKKHANLVKVPVVDFIIRKEDSESYSQFEMVFSLRIKYKTSDFKGTFRLYVIEMIKGKHLIREGEITNLDNIDLGSYTRGHGGVTGAYCTVDYEYSYNGHTVSVKDKVI